MKRFLILAAILIASCARAADVYWVGSGSGSWNEASNWSGGVVPNNSKYRVFVTNETALTINVSGWVRVGAIEFSGADHVIASSNPLCFEEGDFSPYIHVEEGRLVQVGGLRPWVDDKKTPLKKTGAGVLKSLGEIGQIGYQFNGFEVAGGELVLAHTAGDSVRVGGRLLIRSGAKVKTEKVNLLHNETIVEVEKGAVFDSNNLRDTIGGFIGEGVVTNLPIGTSASRTSMTCGPLTFGGDMYGEISVIPNADYISDGDDGYFMITKSNALANAKIELQGDASVFTNVLRFAGGVGDYYIGNLWFYGSGMRPLVLEDIDGGPVRLHATLADNAAYAAFAGRGDFVPLGIKTYVITNEAYSATGTLTVGNGGVLAGTGNEGFDASALEKLGRLEVPAGKTFTMQNFGDTVWGDKPCITGGGEVEFAGPGAWTVGNLSLTGGTLTVTGSALATNLTLAGGCSTNFNYTPPDDFTTYITGGEFRFSKLIYAHGNRKFHQSGGKVYGTLQSLGKSCDNEIFYTMTGGYLRSYTDKATVGQYPQGIGLDLSGNAVAELRNEDGWGHRLSSGGRSHTIRLSGNAYLGVDAFIFGEYSCDATGTIQLDGGVFDAAGRMDPLMKLDDDSPLYANVNFNGGTLRSSFPGNIKWSNDMYTDAGHVVCRVQRGGGTIDVVRNMAADFLQLTWPIVSDVGENEVDGGLTKTGYGTLYLEKQCDIDGTVSVTSGSLVSLCEEDGGCPYGRGGVFVRNADIMVKKAVPVTMCSNEGAAFTYAGCASFTLSGGANVTLGNEKAESPAFVRDGHGVLLVSAFYNNGRLGDSVSATSLSLNGAPALDKTTGILKDPIFERCRVPGNNQLKDQYNGFLTVDSDNRLVAKAAEAFVPESSTRATVAEVSASAVTVSDDTAVGALSVSYVSGRDGLTIASGKTLSVGSGEEGSVAPILLNSMLYGDKGYGSILGGNIDFGSAEGVIVLNRNYGSATQARITSAISGSGGLTIAAPLPLTADVVSGSLSLDAVNSYTGGTWIENAVVLVTKAGSFGSGTVHVGGDEVNGSALIFNPNYNSSGFANNLVVSGFGPHAKLHHSREQGLKGALVMRRPVKFTGEIVLQGDSKVALAGRCITDPTEFAAAVSGDGALRVTGNGCLRLSAANSYSGGTVVESGVLEVSGEGTLGSGPVEVCEGAELRFVNASAKSIANVITGKGRISCNGAAVSFSDVSGFEGPIEGVGAVSGSTGFRHDAGTEIAFTDRLDYSGDTVVSAGTLRLGDMTSDSLPGAESVCFRLDASVGESLTLDGDTSAVLSWADADGRDIAFTNVIDNAPVLIENRLGSKPAVYFDGTSYRRLIADTGDVFLRTVAMVYRVGENPHPKGWSNVGLLGYLNQDVGLRMLDRTRVKCDSLFTDGVLWANGVSKMVEYSDFTYIDIGGSYEFKVLAGETPLPDSNSTLCIGDYFGSTYQRSYYGDIAECIVYDRALEKAEHDALYRHLAKRWGLAVSENVYTNVLPTATSLTIEEGARVDLAGGSQEIASLSGSGTLANSGPCRAKLTLASGTSLFTGAVQGDIYLEIAAGATLDLGGGSITVAAIGGSGCVVNGIVTVTDAVYPGGDGSVGTLTFAENATLVFSGATLFIDGDRTVGAVDLLALAGGADVSALALSVPVPGSIAFGTYDVISAAGGVSGQLSGADLPARGCWGVVYEEKTVKLNRQNGTIIVVR